MKLIDLLVKELPKRGGWPDGAHELFMHSKVSTDAYFYNVHGGGVPGAFTLDVCGVEYEGTDEEGFGITRPQYEAALADSDDRLEQDLNECIGASEAQVRNGDGVPPIGCSCEMQDSKGAWLPVVIIAKNDGFTFGWSYDYQLVFFGDKADEFRPLRTEAEKLRDAAEKLAVADIINEMKMDENSLRDVIIAQKIYRAVCEGRIRGVNVGDK